MRIDRNRWNRRTLAAALVLGAPALLSPSAALAQNAGTSRAVPQADAQTGAAGVLTQAKVLMDQGKLIEAKATLDRLLRSSEVDHLSEKQQSRVQSLVKDVNDRIMRADPLDVSLQKADLALASGDLAEAQRQARAVSSRNSVSPMQKDRADELLAAISTRQAEIAPMIAGRVEQAQHDFATQKYAAAKAAILEIQRSGVQLTPDQAASLERSKLAIIDLENANGHDFPIADAVGFGDTRQPGTVRRPGTGTPPEPGRPEPLPPAMAGEQPPPATAAPATPPAPAPADAQPATPPAAAPTPPAAPAPSQQDDIVTAAMKLQAAQVIAEGDAAYDQARFVAAADKYSLALAQFKAYISSGEADRVQKRLDESRLKAGSTGGGSIVTDTVAQQTVIRSRAQSEFDDGMRQAEAALNAGQPDKAVDQVANARLAVANARAYFNDTENDAFKARIDAMKAKIDKKTEEIRESERRKRELDQTKAEQAREQQQHNQRDAKIGANIARIRDLQHEQKYDEALQIIDQTLFIDPNDPTALLLRDIIGDMSVFKRWQAMQGEKMRNQVEQTLDNQASMIPPAHMMDFPKDWPNKTYQRGELSAYAETPENRAVLAKMSSPANKIAVAFTDNRFEDVMKFISNITQITVDPDWESLASIGVEKDTPVTLNLQSKITIQAALERVLGKVSKDQYTRAGWGVSDGVINVGSEESLRKHKALVIYNIQDLLFQIPNYRQVPQIDLNNVLQSNQGGGGGQSPFNQGNDNNQQQQDDPAVRERRIRQIIDILYANVDFEGWKDNGGETGSLQELNGSLIITNTPKNHREIVGLLSKLREIRNMQINVETKFLLVNQSWFEQIGFDIDLIFNANSNQVTRARTNDPSIQPVDFFNFGSTATTRGLQRQVTGQGSTTAPSGTLTPLSQGVVNPQQLSPIGMLGNSLGLTTSLSEGDFASTVLKQAPALGIAGSFLDDIQVNFLVVATQADKRSVRLTAPKLTFTNGQTANIYVATQQAFVSQLTPVVGDSAVGFNPQTAVVSEGVTMLIEGVISSDRRYVTLNIDSGVSRIDSIRQSPVTAIAGGQLVNSGSTQSFLELPQVTVTRVRTTATIPDEGTLLLGGQRLITEVEVETGVPVLSKIPILNRFFTNRLETKEEQSLLILCKPTILIQTEEEERAFPGVNDQLRSGLGLR
jgi:type II secretory pathway component GspD/PulD (secretin)